jgi:hypothetical protein
MGQARRHYASEPTFAGEVDHHALLTRLERDFDGWALSASSPSLFDIIPLINAVCKDRPRIMAWVKPFASFKPGVNPAYAWEPIIVQPVRDRGRAVPTCRDWVSANITLKRGLSGAKPEAFSWWLFEALGMTPDDEMADLFPGTGGVTRAWQAWRNQLELVY